MLKDWMKDYAHVKLGKLHMPGSHDAGTAKGHIEKSLFGTDSNAATQTYEILSQLRRGTRFFDLRLTKKSKRVVAHHTTAGQGAFSKQSFNDILSEAADWWQRHQTEVIIFRISHTDPDTNAHEIITASAAGALHTGHGNLCLKSLQHITKSGGGIICILDREKFGPVISQSKGIHSFKKYNGRGNQRGIATCGCYKGTHALDQVIATGLRGSYEHNTKHNPGTHDHLWQLYWQKAYLNPASTTGIESGTKKAYQYDGKTGKVHGGTHAATDHMIRLMKGFRHRKEDYEVQKAKVDKKTGIETKKQVLYSTLGVRNYMLPNIISYDFVNEEINKKIIDLNRKFVQNINGGNDD